MDKPGAQDVGDRRAAESRGCTRGRARVAVLSFFLAGLWLNGEALHEQAHRRPYGVRQRAWVEGTRPLAWAARVTRAGRLRAWIETAVP